MRMILTALLLAAVQAAPSYPPPFPRLGASRLLANEHVQVWDVAWPKGRPTRLHQHRHAMTGLYYAPGDRIITAVDGSKRPVTTKAGGIVWQLKGVTHIEEGTSDPPLRAVMIELRHEGPSGQTIPPGTVSLFAIGDAKPLLDNERVTVWEYAPPPPKVVKHHHWRDAVGVWLEAGTAHAVWMPRGSAHIVDMPGVARATIFELK